MNKGHAVLLLFLFASPAQAQWMPITAKVRETRQVSRPGEATQVETREGSFYPRTDGSILVEWTSVDGDPRKASGHLSLGPARLDYQLNLTNRTAVEREAVFPTGVDGLPDPARLPKTPQKPLRQEFIGAVACAVYPLFMRGGPTGAPVPSGEACWSHELGLMLKRDSTRVGSDGRTYHTVYETHDIELSEPDPTLFDLQARGFSIYRKDARP